MFYLTARNQFLATLGELTEDERTRAIAAFDTTFVAHVARLNDAWAELMENIKKEFGL